jgi:5'-3' exonuclease, N-terminal resolvase-like domain/T4 RNase H, C terminal
MILIDLNQVMISNLFANIGNFDSPDKHEILPDKKSLNFPGQPGEKTIVNENLIRHMVLNSLRYYRTKFGSKYGNLIICCDNNHYWRKDYFPFYKASRKKNREKSVFDWHVIFDSLNKLRNEIDEYLPYRVININGAEADDLIGVIAKRNHTVEKVLILGMDKDFLQLQKYPNIEQYAPIKKQFVVTKNPIETLREHIMLGDLGDGIPNFCSPDDTFVSGKRQVSIRKENLARWVKESRPENFCDVKMLHGYKRNQKLIDLEFIPRDLQNIIISNWEQPYTESRKYLLDYFVKNKLDMLMDHIGEF